MSGRTKRIAWVTGGARGIGQAGAETLAADGWTVVISGRRPDALAATAEKIRASRGAVDVFPLDVTDADEIAAVTSAILAKYGRIDLLVNSAGLNLPKRSWEDMELKGWDQIVDVNLNGLLYCMRAVLPAMRAEGRLHHQCSLMGRPHRLESDWACLQRDETCSSGTHALLQHGRMSKWSACMLPLSSRGRDSHHEEAAGSPERGGYG